ncbi:SLAIN motif-containing protein 1-like isoform X2 [Clupea harengus]|uniref:SLAIN motif-containing protein 1-like isoform X2 n=1 Tax=Clupea harengus TaxID=7950 RepID=A0A8M1KCF7_CLUHA|nr:SLAIN motif-containing protein 1-like isoform X2 [Clupea harengus]
MEAAVLNPQMMTDVNCNNTSMNAELEVKKLQELVRKLEMQNEQLRTRANAVNGRTSPHILSSSPLCLLGNTIASSSYCIPSPPPTLSCPASLGLYNEEPFPYFQPHNPDDVASDADCVSVDCMEPTFFDDLEILNLDSLLPCNQDSEETWLYVSPKTCLWVEGSLTPLQWCRQVLDNPRPEVEAAKRSLCHRLDSVHRWRGVFSSPASPAFPHSRVAGVSPLCTSSPCSSKSCSTPPPSVPASERQASYLLSSSHPSLVLTPPGKDCSPLAERTPTFLYHQAKRSRSLRRTTFSPQSSLDSELSTSELEEDSIALGYKLQDLTDVQVMARLQEESLRQDYATTTSASANRRSASFSFQFGQRAESHLEEEEEDDDDEEYGQLPPPQPRLTRPGTLQRGIPHSHTFTSIRDWRRSTSTPSTPSTPQYPSAFSYQPQPSPLPSYSPEQQGPRPSSDKLRRSMPNLVRTPSMSSVPLPASHMGSPASIRNSQSFDSSNGLARLQSAIPSPGQLQNRVQSVGNFSASSRQPLKATAYVSPTVKGPTTVTTSTSLQSLNCSGIPLPGKPGSNQAAGRSGLPRPASFIGTISTSRSKIAQPVRSLLTPPKSLSTLSALRDGSWKDGCY